MFNLTVANIKPHLKPPKGVFNYLFPTKVMKIVLSYFDKINGEVVSNEAMDDL